MTWYYQYQYQYQYQKFKSTFCKYDTLIHFCKQSKYVLYFIQNFVLLIIKQLLISKLITDY